MLRVRKKLSILFVCQNATEFHSGRRCFYLSRYTQWHCAVYVCVLWFLSRKKLFANNSVDYNFYSWFNKWFHHDFYETLWILNVCHDTPDSIARLAEKEKQHHWKLEIKRADSNEFRFQFMASKGIHERFSCAFYFHVKRKINQSFFFHRHDFLSFSVFFYSCLAAVSLFSPFLLLYQFLSRQRSVFLSFA